MKYTSLTNTHSEDENFKSREYNAKTLDNVCTLRYNMNIWKEKRMEVRL